MKAMQKVKNFGRDEVGISNLIATLVLIVAAIVGGAFVFMTMRDQATTMSSNPDASIQNVNIAVDEGGNTLATATVKNSGSKPLDSVTVETGQGDTIIDTGTGLGLAPGETISDSISGTAVTGSYTEGEQYIIHLSATASDGSTIDKTLKVRVK